MYGGYQGIMVDQKTGVLMGGSDASNTDPFATKNNAQARPADARAPTRDYKLRVDPKLEPKFDIKPGPRLDSPMPPTGLVNRILIAISASWPAALA